MPDPLHLPEGDTLVDALAAYRRKAARKLGAPPWRVLPNATLLALAKARPKSVAALANVPGMGPVRRQRHGRALVALLAKRRAWDQGSRS